MFVAFAGTDVTATLDQFDMGGTPENGVTCSWGSNGDGALDADVLFVMNPRLNSATFSGIFHKSFGLVSNNDTVQQGCVAIGGESSSSNRSTYMSDSEALVSLDTGSSGAAAYQTGGTIDAIDSSGFDVTAGQAATLDNKDISAAGLNFNGAIRTKIVHTTLPTNAAADWTITGVGFTSQAVIAITAPVSAVDTNDTGGTGMATFALDEDDNAGTSGGVGEATGGGHATAGYGSSTDWVLQDYDETVLFQATPAASHFNSDGMTIPAASITTAAQGSPITLLFFEQNVTFNDATVVPTSFPVTADSVLSVTGTEMTEAYVSGTPQADDRPDGIVYGTQLSTTGEPETQIEGTTVSINAAGRPVVVGAGGVVACAFDFGGTEYVWNGSAYVTASGPADYMEFSLSAFVDAGGFPLGLGLNLQ